MVSPTDEQLLQMDGWPGGVNNRVRETEMGQGRGTPYRMDSSIYLRDAINVDLTSMGHPIRRKGYTQQVAGYTHSLWGHVSLEFGLCVHEGSLTEVLPDGTLTALTAVHPYAPMSYTVVNQEVYWSNGLDKGRVIPGEGVTHWGLPEPAELTLTVTAGSLPEGTYRLAAVYVDADDEEYGASNEALAKVGAGEGLTFTIPGAWPAGAAAVRVFASQPDGEILYEVGTFGSPGTATLYRDDLGRGRELETLNLKQPKAGKIVRYYNGRVYVARHDTVFFTEALRYGLTRPAQGLYMFPSDVTLLEPVVDGVYVGTKEGVVFLAGTDPYDVQQINVSQHAPVPRASTMVPGEFLEVAQSEVPLWWGVDGAMVAGLPGGTLRQLTKDRLAVPRFNSGAMVYREQDGMAHVVSSLSRGGETSALSAQDTAVATVRRNTTKLNC